MMRCVYCTTALSVVVTPLTTKVALGSPVSLDFQYPQVQSFDDAPVCFMQTSDGRILNLQALCGKQSASTSPPESSPEAELYNRYRSHYDYYR